MKGSWRAGNDEDGHYSYAIATESDPYDLVPDLRLGGVLCRLEYIACGCRTRHVLRTLNSEVHPSRIHGIKHFFGRSGMALWDAELLERFRPPCTRDRKGFHVEAQNFSQLLRDVIRADHRTKLDDALP